MNDRISSSSRLVSYRRCHFAGQRIGSMFIYGENRHRGGFCFEWNGQFCFVECLPMECSSLCKLFERFSTAVQWMAQHKQGGQHMTHMNKKKNVYIYSAQQSASVKTKQNKNPGYVPRYKCTNFTRKNKTKTNKQTTTTTKTIGPSSILRDMRLTQFCLKFVYRKIKWTHAER